MKKTFAKMLCLLMALCMLLSLAACGSKGENDAPGSGQQGGSNQNNAQNPEFAYVTSYEEIYRGENYYYPRLITDEGFYSFSSEKVGELIPEGAVKQYEGQFDVYETRLYFVSDGKITKLENFAPMVKSSNGANVDGKKEYYAGSDISSLFELSDGNLLAIENTYASWYEGDGDPRDPEFRDWEGYKNENAYYIRVLDKTGAEVSVTEIPVGENEYLSTYNAKLDAEDNIILSSDMSLRAYSRHGELVCEIPFEYYIDNIVQLPDGSISVMAWNEGQEMLIPVDISTGTLGEAAVIPNDAWNMFCSGGEYDLYYTSGLSLFGYDLASGERERVINWLNCDVNGDNVSGISVNDDGSITCYSNDWDSKTEEYTLTEISIEKVPYDSVPHKNILRFATFYMDYVLRDYIIDFNRSSETCRVEVTDYSEFYEYDENGNNLVDGLTVLQTEIMAGNVPDIIELGDLPYSQLASKGILADLYPLIDADAELSREDFFPNVFSALEVGGGLYAACAGFSIRSLIGASSVVGDEPGWTFDDYYAALESMPEGCEGFDVGTTKQDILNTLLAIEMDRFVDWNTGECNFDSEEFIEILRFTDQFPRTFDWENHEWSQQDDAYYRISQGMQMLMGTSVYSVNDLMYNNMSSYFGGKATYIGYPSSEGTGNIISMNNLYGISNACPYKEEAWQLVRTFLTEEYQEDQWQLPSNKNVFDAALEKAMTVQYEKDAEGNFILDPETGEKVPIVQGWLWNDVTGEETPVYCLSQEDADAIVALVNTTTKFANYNDSVYQIVLEQAEAYFAGQKSAEEVARLIQSKANIYVNEQR